MRPFQVPSAICANRLNSDSDQPQLSTIISLNSFMLLPLSGHPILGAETDVFRALVMQNFDGIAVEDGLHIQGQSVLRGSQREGDERPIEAGQGKGWSQVNPPQGFDNSFGLAPVAPEDAGQFDDH